MKYLLSVLLFIIPACMIAQSNKYPEIDIPFKKFVLANGLTVVVHEDHKLPLASFNIWYHVGSKNEKPGKTGFAHLFEHIMFTSTEHWNNFDEIMQTVGGANNNGTTWYDRTNYYETFAVTGLDRVLWLEADRMGYLLKGLDSTKIDIQRGVVQNEKRQRESEPYAIAWTLTPKATYPQGHPYSWSVIGSMEDLSAASVTDVKEWFRSYYGPNNAVVSIAGDVNAAEVLEKVKKYFGDIPAGPPITKFSDNVAKMKGITRQQAEDRVPQARLQKTWNIPAWGTNDGAYLKLLSDILTNGKSSRLYKKLVLVEELATTVESFVELGEIGGQFYLQVDAKPGVELEKINTSINQELKKIFATEVSSEELSRTKTNFFVQLLARLQTLEGKTDFLSENQTYGGSPDAYKKTLSTIKTASPANIKKAAIDWLTDGEYILEILPYADYSNTNSKLDRNIMPPVSGATAAKFPAINSFMLSNGLKVHLVEKHDLPLVSMLTSLNAGFSADKALPGLAKMNANMLMEGTTTRSATQLSDQLNSLGTKITTNADLDNSTVKMNCLKTNFDASLNLYSDILLHPAFPAKELDRVRKEQLVTIEQEKAAPRTLRMRVLPDLLYPEGHVYRTPSTGTGFEESVMKITGNDLSAFHRSRFVPNNAFMIVVGDISATELKAKLEKNLEGWSKKEVQSIEIPDAPIASAQSVYIIDKPEAQQSAIYAAEIAPSIMHKGYDAFNLMNNMFGATFLSRLNMNLREDKHWTYGARSGISPMRGPGFFLIATSVQTDKTKESVQEIIKELQLVTKDKLIAQDEFAREQSSVLYSIPAQWQTNDGILNFLSETVLYDRGLDYPGKYSSIIQNFKLPEIRETAVNTIKPASLTWLIIGDRQKIEKEIRELNLGPVKILDANGKEVK